MNLRPEEAELSGNWIVDGSTVVGDAVCQRIEHLVASVLTRLGASKDAGGWDTLFRDPSDGRLWERTYPRSYMHGGGPPMLAVISEDEALARYGPDVVRGARQENPDR